MRLCDNCYRRHWKAKIDPKTGLQVTHKNGHRVFLCIYCGHAQEEEQACIPIPMRIKANVLYIDLEISKSVLSNYGLKVPTKYIRHENLLKERYVICWTASYVRSDSVWSKCITAKDAGRLLENLRTSETDCDKDIIQRLHELMSAAEVIAGHNVRFDIRHANTRFLYYGLPPIGEKKIMDTLSIARTKFDFESRSLDYISKRLGLRPKDDITNDDWNEVLYGNAKVLKKIADYNKGDVLAGKQVYEKLEGWSGKKETFGSVTLEGEKIGKMAELNDRISELTGEVEELMSIVERD